ncbi:MAG TPA: PAAR domain-containing protein [Blastocatellia bacterium]|nr:PAAR domain-containing protein [Blastocatellia bacterium]
MKAPAARQGDLVFAIDTHFVMVPATPSPVPLPHIFSGEITGAFSTNVNIMGKPAATVGSTVDNTSPHVPVPPGVAFQNPPSNKGTIISGSGTVMINGKMAARMSDSVMTCDELANQTGMIISGAGSVLIG